MLPFLGEYLEIMNTVPQLCVMFITITSYNSQTLGMEPYALVKAGIYKDTRSWFNFRNRTLRFVTRRRKLGDRKKHNF